MTIGPKNHEFFYCFTYNTNKIRKQNVLSKMNRFLKILIRKNANSENIWTLNQLPKFEFTDYKETTHFISSIKFRNNILLFTVMKSTEIYLEIPYKSLKKFLFIQNRIEST